MYAKVVPFLMALFALTSFTSTNVDVKIKNNKKQGMENKKITARVKCALAGTGYLRFSIT